MSSAIGSLYITVVILEYLATFNINALNLSMLQILMKWNRLHLSVYRI